MLKFVPLKSLTWLLLVAVLALTLGALCRPVHADSGVSGSATQLVQVQSGSTPDCPCSPLDHGHDHDGDSDGDTCDNCASCGCHASVFNTHTLPVRIPWLTIAGWHEPFRYLPEVYLSLFVPPQA